MQANVIWKLGTNVLTGVESMWGGVEIVNGEKGDAARVQAMLRYNY